MNVIVPMHLYGLLTDTTRLRRVASDSGLYIVEDAAPATGSTISGRKVGPFGLSAFSLYTTKNAATGEGGAVTTNDIDLADRIQVPHNQRMRQRYEYIVAGHNYRMIELQAAVGIPQLERLEAATAIRQENARLLTRGLSDLAELTTPSIPSGRKHVFSQYAIRVTGAEVTSKEVLTLPVHPDLSNDGVERIIATMRSAFSA